MIVEERVAGAVDDVGGEGAFEDHHAGPVGERADQFGLQRPAVGVARAAAAEYTSTLLRTSAASG